jgi:large subunit ribosomal protein L22
MMIARALIKYIRMSPRKVRYVIEPLRRKTVAEALNILSVTNRRASRPVAQAIRSAFANARQTDPTIAEEQVVIDRIFADGGPTWKRFRAAAFGRAVTIHKRTSHLTVELDRVNGRQRESQAVSAKAESTTPTVKAKRGAARATPTKTRKPVARSARKPTTTKTRKAASKKA